MRASYLKSIFAGVIFGGLALAGVANADGRADEEYSYVSSSMTGKTQSLPEDGKIDQRASEWADTMAEIRRVQSHGQGQEDQVYQQEAMCSLDD